MGNREVNLPNVTKLTSVEGRIRRQLVLAQVHVFTHFNHAAAVYNPRFLASDHFHS